MTDETARGDSGNGFEDDDVEGKDDFEERWEEIVAGLGDFDAELKDLDDDLSRLDGGQGIAGDADGGFADRFSDGPTDRFDGDFIDRFDGEVDADGAFEEPEVVANLHAGPRDWSAPEEEGLDIEDGIDVVELGTLMPIDEEVPEGHPMSRFLWLGAALLLLMGVLAAFDLAPGGTPLAFAWGAAGFVCAGVAAFLTSPRSEDIDPFDDGARL